MSIEDRLYKFLKLYKRLPLQIKNFIGSIYRLIPIRIKYGGFYFSYLDRIKNPDQTFDFLLKEHLQFVIKKIPYYNNCGYKTILDFPVINKSIIRSEFDSFLNPENTNYIKANTGGSSGTPFEFYLEKGKSRPKEKAHFDWYWKQFGYKLGSKMLMIRGEALAGNKLYEYQAIENRLAISCYLINESNIQDVINAINKFNPEFIHAYPSAIKNFIDSVEKNENQLKLKIKAVFLGSEGLYKRDRELIRNYFNTKVAHWYGHSERLVHAGNCAYSDEFHVFPFYGYSELLDDENNVITKPNIKGRIVATGFDNQVMPIIRYDTGDEAEYSENTTCKCGFKGISFKQIYGRSQDYVYLNDKTKVSLTAFIFGQHFEEFKLIKEIQLEQSEYGFIEIRIVSSNMSIDDSEKFIAKLKDSVKNKIEIKLDFVNEIPKTPLGKHIFLKQKIK